MIASGNKKICRRGFKKECTYIPRSERKFSETGGHSSRTCGNSGNTNQGNAHLHRELIWTVVGKLPRIPNERHEQNIALVSGI